MQEIYLLDSSAMDTLNLRDDSMPDLLDDLVKLRDAGALLYSEAVKEERRNYAKKERMTAWASSGWRSISKEAAFNFTTVTRVLWELGNSNHRSILDADNPNPEDQQALTTVSLAYELKDTCDPIIVSDETFTVEDRCTVKEACAALQIKHMSVDDFLTVL